MSSWNRIGDRLPPAAGYYETRSPGDSTVWIYWLAPVGDPTVIESWTCSLSQDAEFFDPLVSFDDHAQMEWRVPSAESLRDYLRAMSSTAYSAEVIDLEEVSQ